MWTAASTPRRWRSAAGSMAPSPPSRCACTPPAMSMATSPTNSWPWRSAPSSRAAPCACSARRRPRSSPRHVNRRRLPPRRADPLGQGGRHEAIQVAVQNAGRVRGFHPRAQVLDHLVGLQDVGSDLVTPADIGLGVLHRLGGGLAAPQFGLVETGAQHLPGLVAILVL